MNIFVFNLLLFKNIFCLGIIHLIILIAIVFTDWWLGWCYDYFIGGGE